MSKKPLSDFVRLEDGTYLWSASLILLKHLQSPAQLQQLVGKRVLELGSGLGHLGYGLCKLGCHVTCTEQQSELPALEASLARQKELKKPPLEAALEMLGQKPDAESVVSEEVSEQGSIQAVCLEWGEQGFHRSPLSKAGTFDIIVCSELYYVERLFPDLLWTLKAFSRPGTTVWSIFIDRPFSFLFFSMLSDEGCWNVEAQDFDDMGLDQEIQAHMHKITFTGK